MQRNEHTDDGHFNDTWVCLRCLDCVDTTALPLAQMRPTLECMEALKTLLSRPMLVQLTISFSWANCPFPYPSCPSQAWIWPTSRLTDWKRAKNLQQRVSDQTETLQKGSGEILQLFWKIQRNFVPKRQTKTKTSKAKQIKNKTKQRKYTRWMVQPPTSHQFPRYSSHYPLGHVESKHLVQCTCTIGGQKAATKA
mgnify:FL=1